MKEKNPEIPKEKSNNPSPNKIEIDELSKHLENSQISRPPSITTIEKYIGVLDENKKIRLVEYIKNNFGSLVKVILENPSSEKEQKKITITPNRYSETFKILASSFANKINNNRATAKKLNAQYSMESSMKKELENGESNKLRLQITLNQKETNK